MIKGLFIHRRLYWVLAFLVVVLALGFAYPMVLAIGRLLLLLLTICLMVDAWLLFRPSIKIDVHRITPKLLSLSDENDIYIQVKNLSDEPLNLSIIDELPFQLQVRNFNLQVSLAGNSIEKLSYSVRPTERGAYHFGQIHCFLSSMIGLLERRITSGSPEMVPVYPSVIQMKRLELNAFKRSMDSAGLKKIRRIGHSYEFDQIKTYVKGDDYRSINWKATGRSGSLMVNQYEDEKSQQVYCVVDKSRIMLTPFNGLSLVDYAINATLALSNVILRNHDKVGLITFSDTLGATIAADRMPSHLNRIMESLYHQTERQVESNFDLLYYASRKLINGRSLFILFTNFESLQAMERNLPLLRKINKQHLLVVVFFENTEITDFLQEKVDDMEHMYIQTVARQVAADKSVMVQQLRQYGIQAVLSRPEDLSINTLNKYLELKARGMI